MTTDVRTGTDRAAIQGSCLGSYPLRMVFLVLVSILAGTFELFLLLTVRSSVLPPIAAYLMPPFHLLPWLAGLTSWGKVRHALLHGAISAWAAELCYGVILAILSAAYVVLGFFEVASVLRWVPNR
jgi:hypothetical protein